ncbi:amidohydrolase [Arthrobacter sp. S2(2024)]|uniref:amidohydrolase n=1 Tax=Arthrobacter sp. S2(2024) TaxID=3111911 RepID=UPI002FCBBD0E
MTSTSHAPHFKELLVIGDILDPRSGQRYEAMLVRSSKIVDVGSRAKFDFAGMERADLTGQGTIVPGFVDAHSHLQTGSRVLGLNISVHTPPADCIDDIVAILQQAAASEAGSQRWIEAQGNLGQNYRLTDKRYPNRHDLDRVSTDRPIIVRFGAHVWAFNSVALNELGIDRNVVLPNPAHVEVDEAGEPTGIVNDLVMVESQMPSMAIPGPAEGSFGAALVKTATDYFTARGVTTIGEMTDGIDSLSSLREAILSDDVVLRVKLYALDSVVRELVSAGTAPSVLGLDDSRLEHRLMLGGYKLAADGGISAREAAVWEPYADRAGYIGQLGLSPGEVERLVEKAEKQGLQVLVHAAGDRAMDFALDEFERAAGKLESRDGRPSWNSTHRIEHLGNVFATDERLKRSRELDVLPVVNIGFLFGIGDSMAGVLGEDFATKPLYRLRTLLDLGFPAVGSSDFAGGLPEVSNPLLLMRVAQDRTTFGGVVLGEDQALSPIEALRSVTVDAAAALDMEGLIGEFSPGALADFVLLSSDPLAAQPDELGDGTVRVLETWLGGKRVWWADS